MERITTREAEKKYNIPAKKFAKWCRQGKFPNAQKLDNEWQIAVSDIETFVRSHTVTTSTTVANLASPIPDKHSVSQEALDAHPQAAEKFSLWDRINQVALVLSILGAIAAIVVVYPSYEPQFKRWFATATPLPVNPAPENSTLILVATFHSTINQTEPHVKIWRALKERIAELGLDVRTEIEPTILKADDKAEAERLGNFYNASMIIWGEDTGVEIIVNFLDLRTTDTTVFQFQIQEKDKVPLGTMPSAYARYVTTELPSYLTFYSLSAIGYSHYILGEYQLARTRMEDALMSLSSDAKIEGLGDIYFRLGWLYSKKPEFNWEKSLENYNQAVSQEPESVPSLVNRGLMKDLLGQHEDAERDYDRALAIDPENATAYASRAVVRATLGNIEGAMNDYEKALELNPQYATAYYNRANNKLSMKDSTGALDDFTAAIKFDRDFLLAYENRADIYESQGSLDAALQDYLETIRIDPSYYFAYFRLGQIHMAQGKLEDALNDFAKAASLIPVDPKEAVYRTGQGGSVVMQIDELSLERTRCTLLVVTGDIYAELKQLENAINQYSKAINLYESKKKEHSCVMLNGNEDMESIEDTISFIYYQRGSIYDQIGDLTKALNDYNAAIRYAPNNLVALHSLGTINLRAESYADAVENFTAVLKIDPTDTSAYVDRGSAYLGISNYDAAIVDFNRVLMFRVG